eukprot:PhF_6_TR18906/c0_g1_i4/m.27600
MVAPKIIWVDSDPGVRHHFPALQAAGYEPIFIPEIQEAMNFVQRAVDCDDAASITGVITSTMRSGGRRERGLPDGYALAAHVIRLYSSMSYKPLLGFITASADEQVVLEHGFIIYQKYDRTAFVHRVITVLRDDPNRDFRMARPINQCGNALLPKYAEVIRSILKSQGGRFADFHSAFTDLCFCSACQPAKVLDRGGEKYVLPEGWFGFGINLREDIAVNRAVIENWPVAFHGFNPAVLNSILTSRKLVFPGDVLPSGTILPVKHGQCYSKHFGGRPLVYVSPSIRYASFPIYATPIEIEGVRVQLALQCRIRPGSYKKFPQTLKGTSRHIDPAVKDQPCFDPFIPDKEIEWPTD